MSGRISALFSPSEAAAPVGRWAGRQMGRWAGGCDTPEGKARDVGSVVAGIARATANRSEPFAPPCVTPSGGETKV